MFQYLPEQMLLPARVGGAAGHETREGLDPAMYRRLVLYIQTTVNYTQRQDFDARTS